MQSKIKWQPRIRFALCDKGDECKYIIATDVKTTGEKQYAAVSEEDALHLCENDNNAYVVVDNVEVYPYFDFDDVESPELLVEEMKDFIRRAFGSTEYAWFASDGLSEPVNGEFRTKKMHCHVRTISRVPMPMLVMFAQELDGCDKTVYSRNRCFRLPNNSKLANGRQKQYIGNFSTISEEDAYKVALIVSGEPSYMSDAVKTRQSVQKMPIGPGKQMVAPVIVEEIRRFNGYGNTKVDAVTASAMSLPCVVTVTDNEYCTFANRVHQHARPYFSITDKYVSLHCPAAACLSFRTYNARQIDEEDAFIEWLCFGS